jgi:uncharacterized delta-60 repeat protein
VYRTFFKHLILVFASLLGASCANVDPAVSILSGAFSSTSPLSISGFSPGGNPTNTTGLKKVTVTSMSPAITKSFRALQVSDAVDCKILDYSTAPEQNIGQDFQFTVSTPGKYKVCAQGKSVTGAWMDLSSVTASDILSVDQTQPTGVMSSPQPLNFNTANWIVNVIFDEAVQNIPVAAWTTTNANILSINNVGSLYSVILLPTTQGAVSLGLTSGLVTDLAGNPLAGSLSLSQFYDSLPPAPMVFQINSGAAATNNLSTLLSIYATGGPSEMYITADPTCSAGGTWAAYANTQGYTLPLINGVNGVYVKYRDPALNESTCVGATILHDSVSPAVSMSTLASYANAPVTGSVTLSETVASFTVANFNVTNGSITTLTNVGNVYTYTVTPGGDGLVIVSFPAGSVVDLAGNANASAVSRSFLMDTILPTAPSSGSLGLVPATWTQTPALSFGAGVDTGSGILNYQTRVARAVDDFEISAWTNFTSGSAVTGITLMENTDYKIQIRAIDRAGNISAGVYEKTWTSYQRPYTMLPWTVGANGQVASIAQKADQSFFLGGYFRNLLSPSDSVGSGVRILAAGGLDSSFAVGTGFDDTVLTSAALSSGKYLVAGGFKNFNGTPAAYLAQLNADGTLDGSFLGLNQFNGFIYSIAVDGSGKILVAGSFTKYGATTVNRIARLNADGSLDSSFSTGTGFNSAMLKVFIQTDASLLVAGTATLYNGFAVKQLVRLNSAGGLDTTFNTNIGVGSNGTLYALAQQTDLKILVGGYFTLFGGIANDNLVRLNTDGTLDTAFNLSTTLDDGVRDIAIQPGGNIVVAGAFNNVNGFSSPGIGRFLSSGARDSAFVPGFGTSGFMGYGLILTGTQIILGGDFSSFNGTAVNRVVKLNNDGSIDGSFNVGGGPNGYVDTLSMDINGKLFVGGYFSGFGGQVANYLAKLNPDTSLDTAFNFGGAGLNAAVQKVLAQPDGKLLVGGNFSTFNGATAYYLTRLNTDGSKDTSFSANTGSGATLPIRALALQSDGKILVGGGFTYFNGFMRNRLVRLNADGTNDASFLGGTRFNAMVYAVALQPDGKMIVVGDFTSYDIYPVNRIVRLNADGSYDPSFNAIIDTYAFDVAVDPAGNILVGGPFNTVNGTTVPHFARLTSNGSLDTAFYVTMGTGPSGYPYKIICNADGSYYLGGNIFSYNGVSRTLLMKIKSTGALDTSLNTAGLFMGSLIQDILIQPNGNIAVGGNFSRYGSAPAQSFVVLAPPP